MAEVREGFWRKHRWAKWVAGGLLLALATAAVFVDLGLRQAEPYLRARIVEGLENRFRARVELDSFHLSLVDGLWAEGKGLRIWPLASSSTGEPLIRLATFRFHAPLTYRPGDPIHVSVVELKGLRIDLPPRSHFEHGAAVDVGGSESVGRRRDAMAGLVRFDVETMECTDAELVMETSKPGKLPLDFAIAHLKLTGISSGGAIRPQGDNRPSGIPAIGFDAELTNPRPVGTIHTTGSFGPIDGADLGESPLDGNYRFEHADLASFKGLAGILSSTGHYASTLRDITVDGQTETPDFRLTHFGNAMPLHTHFHARVDGTNGDTWLEPVDATLGRSHFTAQGQVVRVFASNAGGLPRSLGHDIALTVIVNKTRIDDFLRLASHSATPLLTGEVTAKTKLHIVPGPAPVHERLQLAGNFVLDDARFTSAKIQGRIAQLSLRGQGRPGEVKTTDPTSIRAKMQSSFQMAGGVITLQGLEYTVPGATIELNGTYGLDGGAMNFEGTAKMEASVSKMVGGWKGLLLTPADRFFKKDGAGAEVPIHIEGTRDEPRFGIDFDRMRKPSRLRDQGQTGSPPPQDAHQTGQPTAQQQ